MSNFTEIVALLHDIMEQTYDGTKKQTKRAVSRFIPAYTGLSKIKINTFEACKTALAN